MSAADDSEWWMFSYKVAPCPIQERHDWSTCPNAHRGERAARRCPRTHSYTPEPCPEHNKTGTCAQGVNCPLAHSVFESWLHPSRFRTQLCCFGASCKRRICFFAHDPSQLRVATHTPNSAAAAVAAAATGAPVMRRTQAVVPASMMAPVYPGAAGSPGLWPTVSSPGGLGASAGFALQQHQASPQQVAMAAGPPWVYTSAGWVQAGPNMGQPMLMPMHGMPGALQQPFMPGQMSMAAAGMQSPAALVPVDQAIFSGLAAGLTGLSLQDPQSEHTSSGQGLACAPQNMSPQALLYRQGSGAYGMQAQAAVAGMSPAAVQGSANILYAPPGAGTGANM